MRLAAHERRCLVTRKEDPSLIVKHFDQLALMEPELLTLLEDVRRVWKDHQRFREHFNEYEAWPDYKAMLSQLAGWGRVEGPEELRTTAAYDTVYEVLYAAIPACRCRKCNS